MIKFFNLNKKLMLNLTLVFVFMTVFGTLTHEFGHYSVARAFGYDARINYKSVSYDKDSFFKYIDTIHKQYLYEFKNNIDFPGKKKYFETVKKFKRDSLWITMGGPIQTMLTGTLGFIALLFYRKKFINEERVHIKAWVLIFLSLFWLRQVANLFIAIVSYFHLGKLSISGDEMNIAMSLGINVWSIQVLTGLIGLGVFYKVMRFLPQKLILPFIISGMIGGVLGFYLWIIKFGQFILP